MRADAARGDYCTGNMSSLKGLYMYMVEVVRTAGTLTRHIGAGIWKG
jgi:hypothetical protein